MSTGQNLTTREIEIIRLIADGFTNLQIAVELSITANTANTHRKNILRKLELKNTALLIRFAMENGLLETVK